MIYAFLTRAGRAMLLFAILATALTVARADGNAPGEILVRLKPGGDINAFAASYGINVLDGIPDLLIYSLSAPVGSEDAVAAQLAADSRLVWAETDDELQSPEFKGKVFSFAFDKGPDAGGYINQTAYSQTHMGSVWNYSTGAGTIIAVLDTGATFDHPDLVGHYLPGYNVLQPGLAPWDAADGTTNYAVGHGTMLAGIIAHIAPNASILPVRVMNGDGQGTMMNVAKGLHYAVKAGARVVTMSFGSSKLTEAMKDVIDEANNAQVVMVAAAGNDGTNQMQFPALRSGVVAVTSVESNYTRSTYADFGSAIAVVAPGSGIRSTYVDGGYATWSGTSFSVPFVAVEAMMIVSRCPQLPANSVTDAIRRTAHSVDSYNPLYKGQLGKGMIDIEAAVKSVH